MGAQLDFAPPPRFRLLRRLGEGGMGVVYEAFDEERGARIAIKTLIAPNPEALHRLKREFRALQDIHHPNLVTLGELISEGDQWFFTLELIEGVDFIAYVCPGGGSSPLDTDPTVLERTPAIDAPTSVVATRRRMFDEARIRKTVAQLANGLAALHDAGKVHRDIKPSNVLVTREGRAVLLDFGLVSDTVAHGPSIDGHLLGTPAYMAPEQATTSGVGPEADCYALGAMLYEALAGKRPFEGTAMQVLMRKQVEEIVRPSTLRQGVPDDLEELCMRLLRFAPKDRPKARDVSAFLQHEGDDAPVLRTHSALTRSAPFVGRGPELRTLARAYEEVRESGPIVMLVEGDSGVGKSCLARTFAERLGAEHPGLVTLSGRCFEREAVPYKALDGVIDDLTRRLGQLPEDAALQFMPARIGALMQVFPAFRRVPSVARKPTRGVAALNPREIRRRAFVSLRELLVRLGAEQPLLVLIDDLQWGDADSFSALAEVLQGPDAPSLLLLATVRTGDAAGKESEMVELARALPAEVRSIPLTPLSDPDARLFATELLRAIAPEHEKEAADIAREAAGYPMFIDELVQHAAVARPANQQQLRLDDALWRRVDRLEPDARLLMVLVAIAGSRFPQEAMMVAVGKDTGSFDRSVSLLRVAHLVRTDSREGGTIEPYHDRVRKAVIANLDEETRREYHERLAIALSAMKNADAELLAIHWHAAGDEPRAANQAMRAGETAAEALAFDRAASWYSRATEWNPEAPVDAMRALRVKLGEALSNAGRGALAAKQLRAAAEGANAAESLDLRCRAASELLRCGHLDEGIATLREVLTSIGLNYPVTPLGALFRLLLLRVALFFRGFRFVERETNQVAPRDLTRIDTLYAVAMSLGPIDTIRGQMFQGYHALHALRSGEPGRVARAISLEAGFVSIAGEPAWPRVRALLEQATGIADRLKDPFALAEVALAHGASAMLTGRFRESMSGSS